MENYIKPIKTDLDKSMHLHCIDFLANSKNEYDTPRYYNVKKYDYKTKALTIQSTQNNRLFFKVDATILEISDFDFSDFWYQFKAYRTAFLLKNYPTISTY
jgi:hypothetical protein